MNLVRSPSTVHEPDASPEQHSPLAGLRLARQLTVEETARRAGLTPEQVTWLEDGRVYRFPSTDAALVALLLYATALDVDRREARALAGLPLPPAPLGFDPRRRIAGVVAFALLVAAIVVAIFIAPREHAERTPATRAQPAGPPLPKPWQIYVDVLNGSGDINYTRRVASRIGALGYRIEHVAKANRFDYPETAVYFEPRGERIAQRLARQLGVPAKPLPGGNNPRRLVVIVGPQRGPG